MWVYSCIFCWFFASLDLEVACFVFASGKRTFPNGMLFVRSSLSCLAPLDIVIVGGKRTCLNGMSIFSSIDVPQSSRGFVSCYLVARDREIPFLMIWSVLSSWGWRYWKYVHRFRSPGIMGLWSRLFLFPRVYAGPLIVCRICFTQLPIRSYRILVITVKMLAKHQKQHLSSRWSLAITLGV